MQNSDVFTHTKAILDRSNLMSSKDDLSNSTDLVKRTDVSETYIGEMMNTKRRFYRFSNSKVFATSVMDVAMGCNDAVLPESSSKNCNFNILTFRQNTKQPYNENLCLFQAFALPLPKIPKLEEKISKFFKFFTNSENRFQDL